jgi:hypothetical protein
MAVVPRILLDQVEGQDRATRADGTASFDDSPRSGKRWGRLARGKGHARCALIPLGPVTSSAMTLIPPRQGNDGGNGRGGYTCAQV